ncbi:hypothetical protein C8R44DRAFT_916135 [Mycena epipterygia]|nr:hypothetical protein C8R44DRAFT_916135 [Mycena epipterygia]
MAASSRVPATPQLTFPEDIERAINEVVLNDTRDMCGTMSLVASRFHTWTKPFIFHTVIIRRHDNWMQRISDCLLPHARFIRILVLDLPFTQGRARAQLSSEELSLIRRLLEASGRAKYLAVTWNIWADLERECSALRLEGLYLIWDGAFGIHAPSLHHLQHPAALEDLTVYAPDDLRHPMSWVSFGSRFLPATTHCVNLAYVTYAADRIPSPGVVNVDLKGVTLVLIGRTELSQRDAGLIEMDTGRFPNYSALCMRYLNQVLEEWVAKMEGRESLLGHAMETTAADNDYHFTGIFITWRPQTLSSEVPLLMDRVLVNLEYLLTDKTTKFAPILLIRGQARGHASNIQSNRNRKRMEREGKVGVGLMAVRPERASLTEEDRDFDDELDSYSGEDVAEDLYYASATRGIPGRAECDLGQTKTEVK